MILLVWQMEFPFKFITWKKYGLYIIKIFPVIKYSSTQANENFMQIVFQRIFLNYFLNGIAFLFSIQKIKSHLQFLVIYYLYINTYLWNFREISTHIFSRNYHSFDTFFINIYWMIWHFYFKIHELVIMVFWYFFSTIFLLWQKQLYYEFFLISLL